MARSIWMRSAGAAAALAAGAGIAGLAVAKTSGTTVKTAQNAKLGETILVNAKGRTLYELNPETTRHLLCTTSACFGFWPPLTVPSKKTKLTKAPGIKGQLGLLHRGGFFQVTLDGRPLYRFASDSAKGQTNGNGLATFGGTWHVVSEGKVAAQTTTNTTTTSTTSTTTSTYTYPYVY